MTLLARHAQSIVFIRLQEEFSVFLNNSSGKYLKILPYNCSLKRRWGEARRALSRRERAGRHESNKVWLTPPWKKESFNFPARFNARTLVHAVPSQSQSESRFRSQRQRNSLASTSVNAILLSLSPLPSASRVSVSCPLSSLPHTSSRGEAASGRCTPSAPSVNAHTYIRCFEGASPSENIRLYLTVRKIEKGLQEACRMIQYCRRLGEKIFTPRSLHPPSPSLASLALSFQNELTLTTRNSKVL